LYHRRRARSLRPTDLRDSDAVVLIDFGGDEAGGSVAIDGQGRIVVAGNSRDLSTGDGYAVVTRLLP
jgi:hypothetical protein